ncbi:ESX secretion-associated protein EspG [Nocardia rhamnosiphila]|uniref:ESX secretion-associated protein EspG n=1 Tax=Nocardia rhamnosiphila TaxID=426716 RepID=A0ABV2WV77_9NOCA|nr:ESX secretion-associated protein EspG [Nocardia rhamnosiphila]
MSEPIVYRWHLTGLQFKVLCDDLRLGGLPRPFTFTSDTRFADDYECERNEVRAGLREVTDPRFDAMVRALTRPDIMVLANLWNERHHTDPQQCLRVHAVRRDDRGYVITQRPGETVAHSGGFDIAECSPAFLARTVVGLLPEAGAGRDPQSVSAGLTAGGANPDVRGFPSSGAPSVSSGPDAGVLKVIQGRLGFRARGIIHVGLVWRDLPGDGRYVLGPEAELVGMDGAAMCDWIEARMAEIMVRLET